MRYRHIVVRLAFLTFGLAVLRGPNALAQSSSLYLDRTDISIPVVINGSSPALSSPVAQVSLAAVHMPAPREFAMNDLVTIIVRESIENGAKAEISTEKKSDINGTIAAFPNINPSDLLNFQLRPSSMDKGTPQVNITLDKDYEGDGDFKRSDSFTTRITARVLDVKPNGTLVLEARKYMRSDDEIVEMTLTGTCRHEDITANNTILSTQLFDLKIAKEHQGELRKATKKGLITKFFDTLFNF